MFYCVQISLCVLFVLIAEAGEVPNQLRGDSKSGIESAPSYRSTLLFLNSPYVQGEIGLSASQVADAKELGAQVAEFRNTILADASLLDTDQIESSIKEINEQEKTALSSVLLPHQVTRFEQLRIQAAILQRGLLALEVGHYAEELQITPKQQQELREANEQIVARMRIEFLKKRQIECDEAIETILTSEQKESLKKMRGKSAKIGVAD